jgi:hypothetical protein
MKHTFVGAAALAALSFAGFSAHASCADPRAAGQQSAMQPMSALALGDLSGESSWNNGQHGRGIVGTWHVSYTVEGAPFADAFIQWHSDGTEWENINLPVLAGNICLGSWKQLDERHFFRHHVGWLYSNGSLAGYFTETETDEVSSDGSSYSGTNEQKIYITGMPVQEVTGTSTATRIWP